MEYVKFRKMLQQTRLPISPNKMKYCGIYAVIIITATSADVDDDDGDDNDDDDKL